MKTITIEVKIDDKTSIFIDGNEQNIRAIKYKGAKAAPELLPGLNRLFNDLSKIFPDATFSGTTAS